MLDDIVATKQLEVEEAKNRRPFESLKMRLANHLAERNLRKAHKVPGKLALIAELKRKSPSRGEIRPEYEPTVLAESYARGGATALSVLTDEPFFGGALEHLASARAASGLPCLRKDFLIDPYQVEEARAWGADAVLVIVAATGEAERSALLAAAREVGLDVLVEVHDAAELAWAAAAGATLIGINNRDLRTFELDLATTERLRPLAPADAVVVAESGIFTREDMHRLERCGVNAVLIGEALVTADDPAAKVRELLA